MENPAAEPKWHDNIQKWLFHGFDLWGPSWDFTWDVEGETPYVIAQLGSGDEADSIPALIPREKAQRLQEFFQEKWGGGEVEISALLGHRSQFAGAHKDVELVGGSSITVCGSTRTTRRTASLNSTTRPRSTPATSGSASRPSPTTARSRPGRLTDQKGCIR